MLTLDCEKLFRLLSHLHDLGGVVTGIQAEAKFEKLTFKIDPTMRSDTDEIIDLVGALAMPMSLAEAKRTKKFFSKDEVDGKDLKHSVDTLANSIHDEI